MGLELVVDTDVLTLGFVVIVLGHDQALVLRLMAVGARLTPEDTEPQRGSERRKRSAAGTSWLQPRSNAVHRAGAHPHCT